MNKLFQRICDFLSDAQAQDMIEYVLILGFVALASAALMMDAGSGVKNVWSQLGPNCGQNQHASPVTCPESVNGGTCYTCVAN
jgi:Flp pilus assembly pilin Flp